MCVVLISRSDSSAPEVASDGLPDLLDDNLPVSLCRAATRRFAGVFGDVFRAFVDVGVVGSFVLVDVAAAWA